MRVLITVLALASATGGLVQANDDTVRSAVRSVAPQANIEHIRDSGVPGFREVTLDGRIVYVSEDGKHLFQGTLYDIPNRVDRTDQSRTTQRAGVLASIDSGKAIRFPAKDEKHHVTVFTDIDCGYCRKLHEHVAEFNALGISVDYLFFPRGGLQSPAFGKAVSVWCADDRARALTDAKSGKALTPKMCANPIADAFQVGLRLGVGEFGTPAVFADDGRQLGGYLAPPAMLERLTHTPDTGKAR